MTEISQKTLKLIRDLKANNERDWYKERKPEFEEHVIEPFARFLEDVPARLDAVFPFAICEEVQVALQASWTDQDT